MQKKLQKNNLLIFKFYIDFCANKWYHTNRDEFSLGFCVKIQSPKHFGTKTSAKLVNLIFFIKEK